MSNPICPICTAQMKNGIQSWHFICPICKYENSKLKPAINESVSTEKVDELFRERGLKPTRIANFNKLLQEIIKHGKNSGDILDVGCAHGWFLELANKKGFNMLGIEPDMHTYQEVLKRGLPIRQGFFPDILSKEERFDVIIFNDVFEHLTDVQDILAQCRMHLKQDGFLVLNLPSSRGIFYKLSRILSRFGYSSFFERLWQKSLPSPHLHYFNTDNLSSLLIGNDFTIIASGRLATLRLNGLFSRISWARGYSLPKRLVICFVIFLILPLLHLLPSDIIYLIAERK